MIRQSRTAVFADNGPANGPAPRQQGAQHLRDDLARRQAKRNSRILPAAGGLLAAIAVFILPAWRLEAMVGATGISEMLPLAAPPLGIKARILIAIVMAGLVGAVMMLIAPRLMGLVHRKPKPKTDARKPATAAWDDADDEDWDDDYDAEDASWDDDDDGYDDEIDAEDDLPATKKAKPAADKQPKKGKTSLFDRLAKLRNRGEDDADDDIRDFYDLPRLKPRDAHPDAPARRPIFAHRDLGAPLDSPLEADMPYSPLVKKNAESVDAPIAPAPIASADAWAGEDQPVQSIPTTDQVFGQPPLHLNGDMLARDEAVAAPAMAPAPEPVMPPPYVPNLASAPIAADAAPQPAPEVQEPVAVAPPAPVASAPIAPVAPVVQPDLALSELTLAQLVDRLEQVLAEHQAMPAMVEAAPAPIHPLQVEPAAADAEPAAPAATTSAPAPLPVAPAPLNLAPMPVAAAAPAPVAMAAPATPSPSEEEEMDRALKAALATLERMTAQR